MHTPRNLNLIKGLAKKLAVLSRMCSIKPVLHSNTNIPMQHSSKQMQQGKKLFETILPRQPSMDLKQARPMHNSTVMILMYIMAQDQHHAENRYSS